MIVSTKARRCRAWYLSSPFPFFSFLPFVLLFSDSRSWATLSTGAGEEERRCPSIFLPFSLFLFGVGRRQRNEVEAEGNH